MLYTIEITFTVPAVLLTIQVATLRVLCVVAHELGLNAPPWCSDEAEQLQSQQQYEVLTPERHFFILRQEKTLQSRHCATLSRAYNETLHCFVDGPCAVHAPQCKLAASSGGTHETRQRPQRPQYSACVIIRTLQFASSSRPYPTCRETTGAGTTSTERPISYRTSGPERSKSPRTKWT